MDKNKEAKYWGIGSLAISLFFPTLAVIAGIISLVKGKKNEDKSHKGFAISGIVLGGLNWLARFALTTAVLIGVLFGAVTHSDLPVDKGPNKNGVVHSSINPDCPSEFFGETENEYDMTNKEAALVACQVIGMDEKSAVDYISSKGFVSRIAQRDEEGYPLTMDYRTERINLFIRGGIVFDTNMG